MSVKNLYSIITLYNKLLLGIRLPFYVEKMPKIWEAHGK